MLITRRPYSPPSTVHFGQEDSGSSSSDRPEWLPEHERSLLENEADAAMAVLKQEADDAVNRALRRPKNLPFNRAFYTEWENYRLYRTKLAENGPELVRSRGQICLSQPNILPVIKLCKPSS